MIKIIPEKLLRRKVSQVLEILLEICRKCVLYVIIIVIILCAWEYLRRIHATHFHLKHFINCFFRSLCERNVWLVPSIKCWSDSLVYYMLCGIYIPANWYAIVYLWAVYCLSLNLSFVSKSLFLYHKWEHSSSTQNDIPQTTFQLFGVYRSEYGEKLKKSFLIYECART